MNILKKYYLLLGVLLFITLDATSQTEPSIEFQLDTKKIGSPIQSTMYGLFFEDINFAADGGLYPELVKNRSFDFPQNLMGWYTFGNVDVMKQDPLFPNNPTYLKLSGGIHKDKHTGIENEGFRGMGFKKDEPYRFSVWAKKGAKSGNQKLQVQFIDSKNNIIGNKELEISSDDWKSYEIIISPKETEKNGRLRVFLGSEGDVFLEHVSLFPVNTWKGRKNGLRNDLAQALADLKPGVFRFPGGCIVEGTDLETRYDWKKSIGLVENRPLNENRWHYTFQHRFFPDYYQTYGLGFYEYFLLSEDIGAEPLPVVNAGLSCQYQNEKIEHHVAMNDLDSYVQDALDLIEFANGEVNSTWGKVRAEMGHPASFNLKFIGIGNEQWGPEYVERLDVFTKALRAKYPEIKIIGSSGPSAEGDQFNYLWPEMKRLKVDLVDEHYYKEPDWFFNNAARYDNYDRKGPAVFAGEYASHDHSTGKQNNFLSALSEAAFMTGLERNADIVHMCTYAPLFAHVDAWQWNPDMIWFDNLDMVKTPNYYVQQLYATNVGTHVMSLLWNKKPITGQEGIYASAVYDKKEKCYIIKVVNTNEHKKDISIVLKNSKRNAIKSHVHSFTLHSDELKKINSLALPTNIITEKADLSVEDDILSLEMKPYTFGVYRMYHE